MVKLPERRPDTAHLRRVALRLLAHHLARAPMENPVRIYRDVALKQAELLAEREPLAFHYYAFNTLRQLGANFELLATHLNWLGGVFSQPADAALRLSEGAKIAQFNFARAMRQKKFDRLDAALGDLVGAYDETLARLRAAITA
jgi:hypothetical protein